MNSSQCARLWQSEKMFISYRGYVLCCAFQHNYVHCELRTMLTSKETDTVLYVTLRRVRVTNVAVEKQ